jgi:hypothetical protein
LYDSAKSFRLSDLPAFALEHVPNRNSLIYGDLYGISKEASTIYRATLRYEGFSEIMATLGKIGFFEMEPHPFIKAAPRPTLQSFLNQLLGLNISSSPKEEEFIQRLVQPVFNLVVSRPMLLRCRKTVPTELGISQEVTNQTLAPDPQ